jgi:hypothetical protein
MRGRGWVIIQERDLAAGRVPHLHCPCIDFVGSRGRASGSRTESRVLECKVLDLTFSLHRFPVTSVRCVFEKEQNLWDASALSTFIYLDRSKAPAVNRSYPGMSLLVLVQVPSPCPSSC